VQGVNYEKTCFCVRSQKNSTISAFLVHLLHNNAALEVIMAIRSYKGVFPKLAEGVYIDPSSVIVGDIELGKDVSIWPLVAARGDVNYIRIGARTNIQDGTVLHLSRASKGKPAGSPLIIGEDVTVGHKVMLHGCILGNRILVGMGAIVMDDVVVEDDVIIGAGSLVPPGKRLQSGYLYVGSPVKQARLLNDAEKTFLRDSAANYVELKNDYMAER
jgi:carbonic anhydrase/acetyltransferase-like protein (isoleucine patch superfamily)